MYKHTCVVCQKEITDKYKDLGGTTGDCHWECSSGPTWDAFLERERNPYKAKFTGWTLDCLLKHVRSVAINFFRCRPEELQLRVETSNFEGEIRYGVEIVYVHKDEDGKKYKADMDVCESQLVRYFSHGPISGDGATLEEAIISAFIYLRGQIDDAIKNLTESLNDMPSESVIDEFFESRKSKNNE